ADATRLAAAVAALTHVDPLDAQQVYWAGRVTLCGEPDDLPRYDAVFDAWFRGRLPALPGPQPQGAPGRVVQLRPVAGGDPGATAEEDQDGPLRTAASSTEVLRHRD